jgi:hypothetical protein
MRFATVRNFYCIGRSEQSDLIFSDTDDAKTKLRAAMMYLLSGTAGGARAAAALEIVEILRKVANGLPPTHSDPFDDGLPGG